MVATLYIFNLIFYKVHEGNHLALVFHNKTDIKYKELLNISKQTYTKA